MPAAPALVQSVGTASSAAAPANFTANYGGNTTAGNLLIALVYAATSGALSIVTPTSTAGTWINVPNAAGANGTNTIGSRVFIMPNTPGGFLAVTFGTLTNVNGIVVLLYEWSGIGLVQPLDQSAQSFNTSASTIATANQFPISANELIIGGACCLVGQTISSGNNTPAMTTGVTATSTLGATNVIGQAFFLFSGPDVPQPTAIGGNFSGATAVGADIITLQSAISTPINEGIQDGQVTVFSGGYQGGIGSF